MHALYTLFLHDCSSVLWIEPLYLVPLVNAKYGTQTEKFLICNYLKQEQEVNMYTSSKLNILQNTLLMLVP